jgi:mono/diheme cytochrome c family protein
METYQLNQVTNFVMNWGENEELCAVPTREPVVWPDSVSELPEGDAANGEGLYTSFGCVGCHGDPAVEGSNGVGPWLGNISVVGAQRIEGLDDAHQYVYESILNPGDFLAPECPPNGDACPNGMPPNFGDRMTLQEMADIIAYITSFEN